MSPSGLPGIGAVVTVVVLFRQTRAPKVRGYASPLHRPGHRPGFAEPTRPLRAAGPIYALQAVCSALPFARNPAEKAAITR